MNIEKGLLQPGPSGRNNKGQWVKGVSGNPPGRPCKKVEPPKSLDQQCAEAAAQCFAQLSRQIPTMTPGEIVAALRMLDKIGGLSQRRRGQPEENLTGDQARERLKAKITELRLRQENHPDVDKNPGGTPAIEP